MNLPGKYVLFLARKIGARPAGSDGEAAAASYIIRAMNDLDVEADTESFSCWKSDTPGILIVYALAVAAYLLFLFSHTLSLLLSASVFLVFQMESYSWAVTSRLMPKSSASNVVCRIRPSKEKRQSVVVVANYDSAKVTPLARPRLARMYRLIHVIAFVCILLITLVGLVGVLASLAKVHRSVLSLLWLGSMPLAVYLIVVFALLLWGEITGGYSPGASDNASGVAAMLVVMGKFSEKPLENTELWGVATARGFAGGRGMVSFLERHRRSLKDAYIINIDHPGRGKTSIVRLEGTMFGFRASRRLRRIAALVCGRSEELGNVITGKCRVKKSDAMVALARGWKAITIGGTSGGTYPGWRSHDDDVDHVSRTALDRAIRLVTMMLEEIDRA